MSYDFIYLPFVIHPQDMVGRSGKGWRGGGGGGGGGGCGKVEMFRGMFGFAR